MKDTVSFKVEIAVDVNFKSVEELIVMALEGGSNYWYEDLKLLCRSSRLEKPAERFYNDLMNHGFSLTDKKTGKAHVVRPDDFVSALVLMSIHHSREFSKAINESPESDTADLYLQLVVHKKVIHT